jgi:hypothetical protein
MRAPWVAGIVGLGLLAAACGGDDGDGSTEPASTDARESAADGTATTVDQAAPSPAEDVPSALDDPDDDSFPEPLIDTAELLSGGRRWTASPPSTGRSSWPPATSTSSTTRNRCWRLRSATTPAPTHCRS